MDGGASSTGENYAWAATRFAETLCAAPPPPLKLEPTPVPASNLSEHASLMSEVTPSDESEHHKRRVRNTESSRGTKRARIDDATSASSSPVKSHTRRCREKVNEKFARLLEALPAAPPGVEVKHKAQILEYAIRVFRRLLERRAELRVDIALASPSALARWAASRPLSDFAALYARKHRWPYVETWRDGVLIAAHANAPHAHLRTLSACVTSQAGIVGRVTASKRPEWLPHPHDDAVVFPRASAAASAGVVLALGVPAGRDSVLLFMDTVARDYCTEEVTKVAELANLVAETHDQMKERRQAEADINFQATAPLCLDNLPMEPFQNADLPPALCL